MKEVKAFMNRNRAADVVHALNVAGFFGTDCNLSLSDVSGNLNYLDGTDERFSIEFCARFASEVKLELVCDDDRTDEAVQTIRDNADTGQRVSGWIYVSDISNAYRIDVSEQITGA